MFLCARWVAEDRLNLAKTLRNHKDSSLILLKFDLTYLVAHNQGRYPRAKIDYSAGSGCERVHATGRQGNYNSRAGYSKRGLFHVSEHLHTTLQQAVCYNNSEKETLNPFIL